MFPCVALRLVALTACRWRCRAEALSARAPQPLRSGTRPSADCVLLLPESHEMVTARHMGGQLLGCTAGLGGSR